MKISTEVFRCVYNDDTGAYIQVGPDGDSLDLVDIRTVDPHSIEYYGKCQLTLHPEYAIALARAILQAAQEAEASAVAVTAPRS